jgi:phosphoribosylglycinamide formyltransferase-1
MPAVDVKCVISDNPDSRGLTIAANYNVEAVHIDGGFPEDILEGEPEDTYIDYLKDLEVELICLAGFSRRLQDNFLNSFPNRIIGVHPSLLPKFPVKRAQQKALDTNVKETGCTIYKVDKGICTGPIIRQRSVTILAKDNFEKLAKRILKEEHILYSEVLREISEHKIKLD